jgi:hypothetical protein
MVSPCASCSAPVVNPCNPCYRPATVPPQCRTVYDTVEVAPARVVAHQVPARYGVVNEPVMVSPPSQAWQSTCGRESVQVVEMSAQYATVARTVMVEPPPVVRQVVPAQYETIARHETVSAAHTVWVPADQC